MAKKQKNSSFKVTMLKAVKSTVTIISVIALILTVVGLVFSIFYDEISIIFKTLEWDQGKLIWITATLGSAGTLGVVVTKVTSGLKVALSLAKSETQQLQEDYEVELNARIRGIETENQLRIKKLEEELETDRNEFSAAIKSYEKKLQRQENFNDIQARKYINAPERIVDTETKKAYQLYLDSKKEE